MSRSITVQIYVVIYIYILVYMYVFVWYADDQVLIAKSDDELQVAVN
jgi:hypothetical protein